MIPGQTFDGFSLKLTTPILGEWRLKTTYHVRDGEPDWVQLEELHFGSLPTKVINLGIKVPWASTWQVINHELEPKLADVNEAERASLRDQTIYVAIILVDNLNWINGQVKRTIGI